MIYSRLEDIIGRTPPNHTNMVTFPIFEKKMESDDCLMMSVSHYLPGGGVGLGAQAFEGIYFVVEGQLTVTTETGDIVLSKMEGLHMSIGDVKSVKNNTNYPATMLVISCVLPGAELPPPPAK